MGDQWCVCVLLFFGQTPKSDIPPNVAPKTVTPENYLQIWDSSATLIGQLAIVTLFGAILGDIPLSGAYPCFCCRSNILSLPYFARTTVYWLSRGSTRGWPNSRQGYRASNCRHGKRAHTSGRSWLRRLSSVRLRCGFTSR